jgi:hypothetical protein
MHDDLREALESRTTEELVSILRNHDDEEWRPEAFELVESILAARGVSPTAVAALGPEGEDVVEHQKLVVVGRYFTPADAHNGRLALEGSGLKAWVVDETLGAIYGVGIGTRLLVRAEDKEAAQAVLEGEEASVVEDLPAELKPPPCPECRAQDARLSSALVVGSEGPLQGMSVRRRDWYYECRACGHHWRDDT